MMILNDILSQNKANLPYYKQRQTDTGEQHNGIGFHPEVQKNVIKYGNTS